MPKLLRFRGRASHGFAGIRAKLRGPVRLAIPLLLARRMLLAAGWIAAQAGGGLLNLTLK